MRGRRRPWRLARVGGARGPVRPCPGPAGVAPTYARTRDETYARALACTSIAVHGHARSDTPAHTS